MNKRYSALLNGFAFISILLVIMLLQSTELIAQKKTSSKVKHWSADISISPFYDSNILKYSDKYIQRFLNREDEGRFHINRYDDMVVRYSAGLSYTSRFIKKLKTTFSGDLGYYRYSFNNIKNWYRFSFGIRQYFYSKSSFMLSYAYIPHFYVRHFRDEDWIAIYGYTPITYQPYEFSKDDFSFWIQHYFFKQTSVRVYLSYYRYFLDKNNTEYDSDDYMAGFRIFHTLNNKIKINGGYKYVYSKAKGFDQQGETIQTSDDVNATNYSHDYFIGIDYNLPKFFKLKNTVSLDVDYERVFYTTNHFYEIDPIHAGRHDKNIELSLSYNISFSKNLDVSAFYSLNTRKTETPIAANAEYLSDEKSYNEYQTGMQINYNFDF